MARANLSRQAANFFGQRQMASLSKQGKGKFRRRPAANSSGHGTARYVSDPSGPAVTRHVTAKGNFFGQGQGKLFTGLRQGKGSVHGKESCPTAKGTLGKWQGQAFVAANGKGLRLNGKGKLYRSTAKGKASSLHGKGKFRHGKGTLGKWQGQRKGPAVQRQILPVTAKKACCCFRSVRSSGHTTCDGKACCRSLFIPSGGAGATAVSQSQHELMTSLAVRHCVRQWQRCIVRTIE